MDFDDPTAEITYKTFSGYNMNEKPENIPLEFPLRVGEKTVGKPLQYQCDDCQKQCACKSSLTSHQMTHIGLKPSECAISQEKVTKHIEVTQIIKRHQCGVCLKKIRSKMNLIEHLTVHDNDKMVECTVCQMKLESKLDIMRHKEIHSSETPPECGEFAKNSDMIRHVKSVHTGNELFQCGVCLKAFEVKSDLFKHITVHTTEKEFRCDICQMKFNKKTNLLDHLGEHSERKPLECRICQKQVANEASLSRHLKAVHTAKKVHQCDICLENFDSKWPLIEHMTMHHIETVFKCELCQMKFNKKISLRKHLTIHSDTFKCNVCLRRFSIEKTLNRHIKVMHTVEEFKQCGVCLKQFASQVNLIKHIKGHTEKQIYKCVDCRKTCASEDDLNTHIELMHNKDKHFECDDHRVQHSVIPSEKDSCPEKNISNYDGMEEKVKVEDFEDTFLPTDSAFETACVESDCKIEIVHDELQLHNLDQCVKIERDSDN